MEKKNNTFSKGKEKQRNVNSNKGDVRNNGSLKKMDRAKGQANSKVAAAKSQANSKAAEAKSQSNSKVAAEKNRAIVSSAGKSGGCPVSGRCGACEYSGMEYCEQLKIKQKEMDKLLGSFARVEPIVGMEKPVNYRNKVHHVFARNKAGEAITGSYEEKSHRFVEIPYCRIEDEKSQAIIKTVAKLCKSFKITIYNENSGYGLLRHVLVRRGFTTGEIMVVLVLTDSMLPGKNNFVKALRKEHPEITTVVINVNDRDTSMVLGQFSKAIYGPGFIKDKLMGCTFRISPSSFYQVNPVQTEKLYSIAIDYAGLTGRETVIDAYCGIGTIGICASKAAKEVIGIELNGDAVKDAIINAKENQITNVKFYKGDAGEFMDGYSRDNKHVDVVFMDPPRSGSTEQFIDSVIRLNPDRVVYVSCGPDTLKRDLEYFKKKGMKVEKIQPVDLFPATVHVETVCLLSKKAPV